MAVENDRVDALHGARIGDLWNEHLVGMSHPVDGRAGCISKRASVIRKDVDARIIRPLSCLPCDVLVEDVVELITVGTGHDNGALLLVDQMSFDVLEHSGLMEVSDEGKFSFSEFHCSASPCFYWQTWRYYAPYLDISQPMVCSLKGMNAFKENVLAVVAKIPRGKTLTYARVAARAGNPRAYRAVGNILNKNYDPKIPCHRVVRSDGTTGGYNRGEKKKIEVLRREGAVI